MKRRKILISIFTLLSIVVVSIIYVRVSTTPSQDNPSYTKTYVDGRYVVRSFSGNNPLCGYDEVVNVSTNKKIYGSKMCEANIIDVRPEGEGIVIVRSSMAGKEEIRVSN